MKSKVIILVAMLMASPSALMAQQSIQKMFDCIVNDGRVKVTSQNHYLDRNPETGKKEAQADVYDIMMPNDKSFKQLVKDTQWSFEKDKEPAYQIKSGKNVGDNYTALAVGDGGSQSVAVGRIRGSEFIYACFLDKDDPEKKHRYAYAFEWADRGDSIQARMAKTYALMPKHRSNRTHRISIKGNKINMDGNSFSFGDDLRFHGSFISSDSISSSRDLSSETWLSNFNTYKNLFLKSPENTTAGIFVTNIYKLCKKADCLDEAEKKMVSKEIMKLKNITNDDFIKELFDMSIERLKK